MPRGAHRRCKTQGPECKGITHPGYDQCSACLRTMRKQRKEEMAEVKRRRAARGVLMSGTGVMGGDGSQPGGTQAWLGMEPKEQPRPPVSLERLLDATADATEIVRRGGGLPGEQSFTNAVSDMLLEHIIDRTPTQIGPTATHALTDEQGEELRPLTHAEERALKRAQRELQAAQSSTSPEEVTDNVPATSENTAPQPRVNRTKLTPDQELEVIELFKQGISTTEIQTTYEIGPQTLYTLVHRHGIPLRTSGASRTGPKVEERPVPEVKASPPVNAPAVPPPTPNGTGSDLPQWVVTYTVTVERTEVVAASSFNDAANAVLSQGEGIDVVSVARKRG